MKLELTLTQEQFDSVTAEAAASNLTAEGLAMAWIQSIALRRRQQASERLQAAAADLPYEKRLELIALNQNFIAANS